MFENTGPFLLSSRMSFVHVCILYINYIYFNIKYVFFMLRNVPPYVNASVSVCVCVCVCLCVCVCVRVQQLTLIGMGLLPLKVNCLPVHPTFKSKYGHGEMHLRLARYSCSDVYNPYFRPLLAHCRSATPSQQHTHTHARTHAHTHTIHIHIHFKNIGTLLRC